MPESTPWFPTKRTGTMTARQQFRGNFFGQRHHRPDGSALTVPSLTSRREARRVANRIARKSRKANR